MLVLTITALTGFATAAAAAVHRGDVDAACDYGFAAVAFTLVTVALALPAVPA